VTRGASAQVILRAADGLEPAYQEIIQATQEADQLTVDETGGYTSWLHVWVGEQATGHARPQHRLQRVAVQVPPAVLGHVIAQRQARATFGTWKPLLKTMTQHDLDPFFLGERNDASNLPRRSQRHKIAEQSSGSHGGGPLERA
jgi:hypothetical protein